MLDTAQNAVYLDLAPQNAASLVSLGNSIAWHQVNVLSICLMSARPPCRERPGLSWWRSCCKAQACGPWFGP